MREDTAIAPFPARVSQYELRDARTEVKGEAEHRTKLDDDGVHLPVRVGQIDVKERLRQSQMGGRADRKEFGEAFEDPKERREEVVAHRAANGEDTNFTIRGVSEYLVS